MSARKKLSNKVYTPKIPDAAPPNLARVERVLRTALRYLGGRCWQPGCPHGAVTARGWPCSWIDDEARRFTISGAVELANSAEHNPHRLAPHWLLREAVGSLALEHADLLAWENAPERRFAEVERAFLRAIYAVTRAAARQPRTQSYGSAYAR